MKTVEEHKRMDDYLDEFDYEDESYNDCPKCGRSYDEIGHQYQYCKSCGWDAEDDKFIGCTEPTTSDYENGDADILTGRWY
ncbi:hypothetical protein LCGC14_1504290 [marine sediment metagenome]|uniref:Uncharacterized protein n=1 Tax=marine sediment metagenome TaxID=412755 RepID=A0A0F9J3K8_9ZZZZ